MKEVQPHEAELRAYLLRRFPSSGDIDDVIQESYLRLLQLRGTRPIRSPKAYLFATARNVILAIFRRPKLFVPMPVTELDESRIMMDGADIVEQVSTSQEIGLLLDAIETLPLRCREIFILRKLHGLSQKEIARRLGISEQTVEVQIGRGARKCAEYLRSLGVTGRTDDARS
jgi:RNA polymerase sigma-70 factor (ECF subfamily)